VLDAIQRVLFWFRVALSLVSFSIKFARFSSLSFENDGQAAPVPIASGSWDFEVGLFWSRFVVEPDLKRDEVLFCGVELLSGPPFSF